MGGHPAVWTSRFASLFLGTGHRVAILSHGNFTETQLGGIPVIKHFTRTAWHSDDRTDPLVNWDKYFKNNGRMVEDMERLQKGIHLTPDNRFADPHVPLEPEDLLIFTTITEYQMAGLTTWYRGLEKDRRPTLICSLMAPSGYVLDGGSDAGRIYAWDTARFYKLAFRNVEPDGDKVHFIALGRAHAAQYSYLAGKPVPPYPALNTAIQPDGTLRDKPGKNVLLYAGASTPTKGAHHLPDILDILCPRHSDWQFTVQTGNGVATKDSVALHERLQVADQRYNNFTYIDHRLNDTAYCQMFNDSDLVLVPYDPDYYYNQSSGLVWEAIATANKLVVPENCCLEWEARSQNAGFETFDSFTPTSIADAVTRALGPAVADRAQRLAKAKRFKAENHFDALKKQLFSMWKTG